MYAALWGILPGPWWVRVLILVVVVAAILYALVTWVFPWVQEMLALEDGTVGGDA